MRVVSLRRSVPRSLLLSALSPVVALLFTACNDYHLGDLSTAAQIASPSGAVRVNQHLQLTGLALQRGLPLTFYVNGVKGGNAEFGTISSTGLYTAPAVIPTPGTVKITATSNSYPSAPPGSAGVAIWNPIPVLGNVTPTGLTEGKTVISVNGSQFIYGAQIRWNDKPVETTYASGNQLIAEIDAPQPGAYPLTVTNPDPGSASAPPLNLKVGPGQVRLRLDPSAGYAVRVTNKLTFGLEVNGTENTAVKLEINGIPGGDATSGTAVSNKDGSITYTAPALVPTPSNVVLMKITSVDNPKVSLDQYISVMNPIPILNSATPMSFKPGTATVTLSGEKFIKGAQVLVNGAAWPATFVSATQLTADLTLDQPGNLDLQVLNPSPGPAASADLIAKVEGTPPTPIVAPEDAARFLEQATFGATDSDIRHLSLVGYDQWLKEQFAMPQTLHEPAVEQELIYGNSPCDMGSKMCRQSLFVQNSQDEELVEDSFWQQAIAGNDQLRQRVKYALTQLFVISGTNFQVQSMPRGEANYYDILGRDSFTNFRQLLGDVTLNPEMGQFLSMLQNDKGGPNTDPDENYAREVMQLFSIGLWELNDDGSQKLDGSGNPIPTYSNNDVMGLAKVFTGFSWDVPTDTSEASWGNCCLWVGKGYGEDLLPMAQYSWHHSTQEKQFLGITIPASTLSEPTDDLNKALDTIFSHPNVPSFFSKQMIQHLVTSNPSPAYINRVAQVFKNDGKGVRGDMKAVITAILMDPEARDAAAAAANPQFGKVREALIRYTEWARAFTAQSRTGSYWQGSTEDPIWGLGEMPLRSPTVFNWFAPGYVPPATSIEKAGLVGPEFQMTNVSSVVGYINFMQDAIGSDAQNGQDVFSSYQEEVRLAPNPDALLDRIDLLLMAGQMKPAMRNLIIDAVKSIPLPSGGGTRYYNAAVNRVKTAIYLTMASPDFAAQL